MMTVSFYVTRGFVIVAHDPARNVGYGLADKIVDGKVIKIAVMTDVTASQLVSSGFQPIQSSAARDICPRVYAIGKMLIDGGLEYVRSQAASPTDDARSDTPQKTQDAD